MTFSIGQKVVCIDARFNSVVRELYAELPLENRVYVIRDIRLGIRPVTRVGDVSLLLVGIQNPHALSIAGLEFGFSADRFRPLDQDQEEQPAEREKSKEPSAKPCEIVQGVSYH